MKGVSVMLPNGHFITIECGSEMISLYSGIPEVLRMEERVCVISSGGVWVNGDAGEMLEHLVKGLKADQQIDLMESLPDLPHERKQKLEAQVSFLGQFILTWNAASKYVRGGLRDAYEQWCAENDLDYVSAEVQLERLRGDN